MNGGRGERLLQLTCACALHSTSSSRPLYTASHPVRFTRAAHRAPPTRRPDGCYISLAVSTKSCRSCPGFYSPCYFCNALPEAKIWPKAKNAPDVEETVDRPKSAANDIYEVASLTHHVVRPRFRITELAITPAQKVPWHCHSNVQDTFYVLEGQLRIFLREPKEEVGLSPGQTYAVRPRRPHLVTNGSDSTATFLVLQGIGEYDFITLA
jgi:quercetin dioxygenase-like cupin family protein